jgi:hypothetical protein
MYIDTKPSADRKLKFRCPSVSPIADAFRWTGKDLEFLLLSQTLHIPDVVFSVSPAIFISVRIGRRRNNILHVQLFVRLIRVLELDILLPQSVMKGIFFGHCDGRDSSDHNEESMHKNIRGRGDVKDRSKNPTLLLSLEWTFLIKPPARTVLDFLAESFCLAGSKSVEYPCSYHAIQLVPA